MSVLDINFLEMGSTTSGIYLLCESSLTQKNQGSQVLEKVYLYCGFLDPILASKRVHDEKSPLASWSHKQESSLLWLLILDVLLQMFLLPIQSSLLGFSSEVISKYL